MACVQGMFVHVCGTQMNMSLGDPVLILIKGVQLLPHMCERERKQLGDAMLSYLT